MSQLGEAGIQERLRHAMKGRAAAEVSVLRGIVAAIQNARIEKRQPADVPLGEDEIAQIVRREIKQREEAIGFAEKGRRADLVEKNRFELEYLRALLPQAPGRAEIEASVRRHHEAGATAIGPLMAKLKEEFGSRLDGRVASEIVREFLKSKGGA